MQNDIIARGRLPLLVFFLGLIIGFIAIRVSVRLIRANVRWWFSNVTSGDTHIHHVVFGVVLTLLSGVGLIVFALSGDQVMLSILAGLFGIGAALILDEFALIFYLRDVYWLQEGRTSVDAVFVAVASTGMILLGFRPFDLYFDTLHDLRIGGSLTADMLVAVINLLLAAVVLLKGKVWTGLTGVFAWPLLIVGVLRLARPTSPWARWRYTSRPSKMQRAVDRERRWRRPFVRAKIFVQDLIAGTPDVIPHVRAAAEDQLDAVVHPAPAPPAISPHRGLSGTIVGLPGDFRTRADGTSGAHNDSEHEPVEPHM